MARTKITQTNIADNSISTNQILNNSIKREDIDTTTPGNAIVTKIIAGTNINVTNTGVDPGTGDVTINVNAIPAAVDFQLEGSLVSQRAKLNVSDSSEINFILVDDVVNSRVNLSANINNLDFSKLLNVPSYATVSSLASHISDSSLHLTSNQNIWLDAITVSSNEVNYLSSATSNIQTQLNNKEPTLSAGTATQYYRGDKTWQPLDKNTINLSNVENIALSTWSGSTNLTTAGTLSANSLTVNGNILPSTTQLYNIGSATQRFKAIYVDEAHLAVATLYLGDTAILGTDAQTVNIRTDPNQHMNIQTSGVGTTTITSAKSITTTTTGINSDIFMNAIGAGSNVRIGATNELQVTATNTVLNCPVTANSLTVSNNLTVTGNLIVNGTTTTVNSTNVTITDNIISLNAGQVGSGVSLGFSGFQIDRGDLVDYQIVFDESIDMFKFGAIGSLEVIASQPWVSSNYSSSSHNHTVDNLSNVTIANKQSNDLLKWNGISWVNSVVDKTFVGLANVDNTSDLSKPVSTAQQTALNLKVDKVTGKGLSTEDYSTAEKTKLAAISGTNTGDQTTITGNAGSATVLQTARTINGVSFDGSANITINAVDSTARIASSLIGAANGVAPLDSTSKISSSYLPSYVDDVLEFTNLAGFPAVGEIGKIYVALDTNKVYRWSGSVYIYITSGAVDSVAGKTGVVTLVKADVGLANVDNTSDLSKPVSTAQQTALDLKANLASPTFTGTVSGITKSMVGLANVDNTSDLSKPVSTAQQTALNLKANLASPTFTGTVTSDNVTVNSTLQCYNIYKAGGTAPAYYMNQDGTGRQHWYWNTSGGVSPTFSVAGEDACDLMHHVVNDGSGGWFQFRTANGFGKAAGSAITWTEVLFAHSSRFSYMGNTVWHSGNFTPASYLTVASANTTFAPIITNGTIISNTLTTSTTASNQVLATISATTYRTIKATISAQSSTSYHATEVLIIHDGTLVSVVEYSPNYTNASLLTVDADIVSGNLRILVSPVNAVTTIKTILTLINS